MARQNCSGLCKPSLLQSFRLFLHDSFSWRSAFQGRDCPLGGTALKTLSVRIPRRLSPGGVGCRSQEIGEMPGKYGKSNGMPRSTARGRRGRGTTRRQLWHSTCSYAQAIDPDDSFGIQAATVEPPGMGLSLSSFLVHQVRTCELLVPRAPLSPCSHWEPLDASRDGTD